MPKASHRKNTEKPQKSEKKILPTDDDVLSAWGKFKSAEGNSLHCERDKRGACRLYEKNTNTLIAVTAQIDHRKIILLNLDYHNPKIILGAARFLTQLNELYDLNWNAVVYKDIQDILNERIKERAIQSGSLL